MNAPVDADLRDQVFQSVVELIGEVIGEEVGAGAVLGEPVGMETSFSEDLELESIEFVALSELLMERYGDKVDFVAWIGDMELEQIIGLTLGALVEHIVSCLA